MADTGSTPNMDWPDGRLLLVRRSDRCGADRCARLGQWLVAVREPGLKALRYLFFIALAGAVLGLFARVRRKERHMVAAVAILLGLAFSGYLFSLYRTATSVPAIHDASTDLDDPPAFVTLRCARIIWTAVPGRGPAGMESASAGRAVARAARRGLSRSEAGAAGDDRRREAIKQRRSAGAGQRLGHRQRQIRRRAIWKRPRRRASSASRMTSSSGRGVMRRAVSSTFDRSAGSAGATSA